MSRGRILLGVILLGLAAAAWLHRNPLELDVVERETLPGPPQTAPTGNALLLVDHARLREAAAGGTWSSLDASYAWWSLLREE